MRIRKNILMFSEVKNSPDDDNEDDTYEVENDEGLDNDNDPEEEDWEIDYDDGVWL